MVEKPTELPVVYLKNKRGTVVKETAQKRAKQLLLASGELLRNWTKRLAESYPKLPRLRPRLNRDFFVFTTSPFLVSRDYPRVCGTQPRCTFVIFQSHF